MPRTSIFKHQYDNGLPFGKALAYCIDSQLKRVENKRASCIIIDGPIGTGKTTIATQILEYVNKKTKKGPVHLKIKEHPQLSLGGAEFTTCFRVCHNKGYKAIVYDEAGDFNKRGAISSFNQTINRLFETYRGFRIIVIICVPVFAVLDSKLFDNQIPRVLIHLTKRNNRYGEYKVYSLSSMNWIRHYYLKYPLGMKNRAYDVSNPNFYGHFLNLPPNREKELDVLSTWGKKELLKKAEINLKGLVSFLEIQKKIGRRSLDWVRRKLTALKIKPRQIINKTKYYDQGVIDVLIGEIEEK